MIWNETEKFADDTVAFRALFDLRAEDITAWNILVLMMRSATEKFDTKEKISQALLHAYAAKIRYSLTGYGSKLCVELRMEYISPALVKSKEQLSRVIELMDEFLNHSLLSNSTLEEAKYLLASRLDSIEEDGDAVAANLAMELAGENHPLSIPMTGRKEDLDKIDLACMERLLAKWQGAPKIILAAGRRYADMDAFLDTVVQERVSQFACPLVKEGNVRFKVAEKQIVQSSLCQIWTTGISPWDADFESLLVLNLMLGQGQKSLLFDSVREQESLCYAISSNLIRYDGVLMVNAGIMADAADKVLDMTKAQVKRLADGDFEDGRLESALLELQDRRKGSQDHAAALLEREFRRGMGLPVRHNPVTRESIMAVADRLALKSWALVKEAS